MAFTVIDGKDEWTMMKSAIGLSESQKSILRRLFTVVRTLEEENDQLLRIALQGGVEWRPRILDKANLFFGVRPFAAARPLCFVEYTGSPNASLSRLLQGTFQPESHARDGSWNHGSHLEPTRLLA